MTRTVRLLLGALLCVAGCFAPRATPCGDGRVCPPSTVCVPSGCAGIDQVKACDGRAQNAPCSTSSVPEGLCRDGVCASARCGDGVVDPGETCDDHNNVSGDGCSADCAKRELCDGKAVDEGEACDDGNQNPADGCDVCRATTWVPMSLTASNTDQSAFQLAPVGLAADKKGNLYISDRSGIILKRNPKTGVLSLISGSPLAAAVDTGDGGPAAYATFASIAGIAVDGLDNLYVADPLGHRVRKISGATGIISTFAGNGFDGSATDGTIATAAALGAPVSVAVDGLGNVYVADAADRRVLRIDVADGILRTFAGTGATGFSGDGGPAKSAELDTPVNVTVDAIGDVFILDLYNNRVRRVDGSTRVIETVAGSGVRGFDGDGGLATMAKLDLPGGAAPQVRETLRIGMTFDLDENLVIADYANHRVRRVSATTENIETIAGIGVAGSAGDGGSATNAQLSRPLVVAYDSSGSLFIADQYGLRRVDPAGIIHNVVPPGDVPDGAAAISVPLDADHIALDGAGNIYIADHSRARIWRVDSVTGLIVPIAGNGASGVSDVEGPATEIPLGTLDALTVDDKGNVYFSEPGSGRIRRVSSLSGLVTTFGGTGVLGSSGDGGPATSATLTGVAALLAVGDSLLIADAGASRVRRIDLGSGVISAFAGTGVASYSGDGGRAIAAEIGSPNSLAVDTLGNVYIADSATHVVRRVDAATGLIDTVAGNGAATVSGDGGPARQAGIGSPAALSVDAAGNLYIANTNESTLRRVDAASGVITTIAGGPTYFLGDGGDASACDFSRITSLASAATSDLFVAGGNSVRKITAKTGIITTVAGLVEPPGMGSALRGHLTDPRALVRVPPATFVAGGLSGTIQRHTDSGWLDVVAGRYPQAIATGNLARFRDGSFASVSGIAWDGASKTLYLAEAEASRIWAVHVVDPADANTWTIAALANFSGVAAHADGAVATARFRRPTGLHFDEASRVLYVADTGNHVIRAIDLSLGTVAATVSTIAGTPQTRGDFGDGLPANAAALYQPESLTRCANGDIFIADTGNQRVRRIDAAGIITTVLGDGVAASSGQGSPSRDFPVDSPRGIVCDAFGNVFVTSSSAVRSLASVAGIVDGGGLVQTVYPSQTSGAPGTHCLSGITIIDEQTLRVADACSGTLFDLRRQRRVGPALDLRP